MNQGRRYVPVAPDKPAPPAQRNLFDVPSPGNVGNVFEVRPSDVAGGTLQAFGTPVRVLDVRGPDRMGGTIDVSLQQETILDVGNSPPDESKVPIEGPLVGIVEFAAGAGLASFEFDIPSPVSFPGKVVVADFDAGFSYLRDLPRSLRNNGILLQLPAASLRVYVRNDARVPYIIGADAAGTPVAINPLGLTQPAKVRVHATYGQRPVQSSLTRSYPICFFTHVLNDPDSTMPVGPHSLIRIGIPAYAKRVFFPRTPRDTTALSVSIQMNQLNQASRDPYLIPAYSDGPIELQPFDTLLSISTPDANPPIDIMQVVFELGI